MSMNKRMTVLLSLVMMPALVALFTVGRGQEGQISSESIAKSISQFNDSNPDNRMQAFEASDLLNHYAQEFSYRIDDHYGNLVAVVGQRL